jgi:hypothetical protein
VLFFRLRLILRQRVVMLLVGQRESQPALSLARRYIAVIPMVADPDPWDNMGRVLRAKVGDVTN